MKIIDGWRDLVPFGIDRLTGEACSYGMRQLCDVSEQGARTIRAFLGLPHETRLAQPWNSGRGNPTGPSVGSVMIPYDLFNQLAAFCLLIDGASVVVVRTDGTILGHEPGDPQEEWDELLEIDRGLQMIVRTYSPLGGPGASSRQTHAMSGRTE